MGHPLLAEVFDRIAHVLSHGGLPLVVFDLDGTLLRTGSRHLAILREFARTAEGLPELDRLREVLPDLTADEFGYFVTDPLRSRGFEEKGALESALERFWSVSYFTSQWCVQDTPAPGALAFVERVREAGAIVWYATGRPEATMGVGTRITLQRHGFPIDGKAALAMRGPDQETDADFKDAAVAAAAQCELVAQFENEPEHANRWAEAYPNALHFLVGDVHSPDAPPSRPDILWTADFQVPAPGESDVDQLLEATQRGLEWVPEDVQIHRTDEYVLLQCSREGQPYNNVLAFHPADADRIEPLLDEIARLHGVPEHRSELRLGESSLTGDLVASLERRGYRPSIDHRACAVEPRAFVPRPTPGIEVRRVESATQLREAVSVALRAFGRPPQIRDEDIARWLPMCTGDAPNARFIAYVDGVAVSTGGVNTHPDLGVAMLWGGGTLERHRGRGAWTSLLNARVRWAGTRGMRFVGLYARVDTSMPLVMSRGFSSYGRKTYWERPASPD